MPSKIIGLLAAVTGLFTGWWFKDSWIPERISRLIRENYPVSGGYEALIAIPVLRLARLSYVMDMKLHASILKLGQWVWALSRSPAIVDNGIQYGVDKVGQSALATSELSEQWDRKTLKSVMEVARVVKESGRRGKKWQSGLVHKELAITITGILILIFVLTLTLIQL